MGGSSSSFWFLASLLCGLGVLPLLPDEVYREFARLRGVGNLFGWMAFRFGCWKWWCAWSDVLLFIFFCIRGGEVFLLSCLLSCGLLY